MKREDEQVLVVLLGIWVISRYTWSVRPAMERAGVNLYEWIHNDQGHMKDLPINPLSKTVVLEIAKRAKFPNPKLAAAIAYAESGGVPNALASTSREYSVGLWQINTRAHPSYTREELSDPIKNAAAAFKISKGGTDWRPWSTFVNGKYKQFLTGVLA